MRILVTGRHVDITDALRDHVRQRVESRLAEFPRLLDVHVILSVEKHRHIAEVVVQVPRHGTVESREESNDMYGSIDRAVDHVAAQVRKWYERRHDHKGDVTVRKPSPEGRESL
jgi:putative sigma-54 modulation protein